MSGRSAREQNPKPSPVAWWLRATLWLASAMIAAPLTILTHELGHFLAGLAFNHPGVVMHYGSVTSDAANASYPSWQVAVEAAAGPFVTCATVILCCYFAARYRPHPFVVAVGLFAPLKFSVGLVFIYYWVLGVRNSSPNFDEFNVATQAGISPFIPIVIGVLVLVGGWLWLVRSIPRGSRICAIATSIVGASIGLALYAGVIGPRLLP